MYSVHASHLLKFFDHYWLPFLVLAGGCCRILLLMLAPGYGGGDADAYLLVGRFIHENGDIPLERGLPAIAPPLYPLLIAGLSSVLGDGHTILVLQWINVASSMLGIWMAGRIVEPLFGKACGALAAAGVALHPALLLYTRDISTEVLYLPLLLGSLMLTLHCLRKPRLVSAMVMGVCIGIGALLRPAGLPGMSLSYSLVMLLFARSNLPVRLALIACSGVISLLVIMPWSVHISVKFEEPLFLTDTSGYNYWDGHHPLNVAAARAPTLEARAAVNFQKMTEKNVLMAEAAELGLGRRARSDYYLNDAKKRMGGENPGLLDYSLMNLEGMWRPWVDPLVHGLPRAIMAGLVFGAIDLFGLAGLIWGFRTRALHPLAIISTVHIAAMTLAAVTFVGVSRYRLGYVDPLLLLWVPYAVLKIVKKFRSRWSSQWLKAKNFVS